MVLTEVVFSRLLKDSPLQVVSRKAIKKVKHSSRDLKTFLLKPDRWVTPLTKIVNDACPWSYNRKVLQFCLVRIKRELARKFREDWVISRTLGNGWKNWPRRRHTCNSIQHDKGSYLRYSAQPSYEPSIKEIMNLVRIARSNQIPIIWDYLSCRHLCCLLETDDLIEILSKWPSHVNRDSHDKNCISALGDLLILRLGTLSARQLCQTIVLLDNKQYGIPADALVAVIGIWAERPAPQRPIVSAVTKLESCPEELSPILQISDTRELTHYKLEERRISSVTVEATLCRSAGSFEDLTKDRSLSIRASFYLEGLPFYVLCHLLRLLSHYFNAAAFLILTIKNYLINSLKGYHETVPYFSHPSIKLRDPFESESILSLFTGLHKFLYSQINSQNHLPSELAIQTFDTACSNLISLFFRLYSLSWDPSMQELDKEEAIKLSEFLKDDMRQSLSDKIPRRFSPSACALLNLAKMKQILQLMQPESQSNHIVSFNDKAASIVRHWQPPVISELGVVFKSLREAQINLTWKDLTSCCLSSLVVSTEDVPDLKSVYLIGVIFQFFHNTTAERAPRQICLAFIKAYKEATNNGVSIKQKCFHDAAVKGALLMSRTKQRSIFKRLAAALEKRHFWPSSEADWTVLKRLAATSGREACSRPISDLIFRRPQIQGEYKQNWFVSDPFIDQQTIKFEHLKFSFHRKNQNHI